jgi:hypothetical protein
MGSFATYFKVSMGSPRSLARGLTGFSGGVREAITIRIYGKVLIGTTSVRFLQIVPRRDNFNGNRCIIWAQKASKYCTEAELPTRMRKGTGTPPETLVMHLVITV